MFTYIMRRIHGVANTTLYPEAGGWLPSTWKESNRRNQRRRVGVVVVGGGGAQRPTTI